jgi:hypothetical protein
MQGGMLLVELDDLCDLFSLFFGIVEQPFVTLTFAPANSG